MGPFKHERRNTIDHQKERERNMYLAKFAFFHSKIGGFKGSQLPSSVVAPSFSIQPKKGQGAKLTFIKCFKKKSLHHLFSSSGAFLRLRCHQLLIIILNDSSKSIKIRDRRTDLGVCAVFAHYIVPRVHTVFWLFPSMALWQQSLESEPQLVKQMMIMYYI